LQERTGARKATATLLCWAAALERLAPLLLLLVLLPVALVALLRRAAPKAALKLELTLRALERTPVTAGKLKLVALALLLRSELMPASAAAAAVSGASLTGAAAAGRCAGKCTVVVPAPAAGLDLLRVVQHICRLTSAGVSIVCVCDV
jgi:hypothetical protein